MKTLSEYFNLPSNSFVEFLDQQRIIEGQEQEQLEKRIKEALQENKEISK